MCWDRVEMTKSTHESIEQPERERQVWEIEKDEQAKELERLETEERELTRV